MAEQELNGADVGARFQQVGREAVSQGVRVNLLFDAGALSSLAAGIPDDFRSDRIISSVPPAARAALWTRSRRLI